MSKDKLKFFYNTHYSTLNLNILVIYSITKCIDKNISKTVSIITITRFSISVDTKAIHAGAVVRPRVIDTYMITLAFASIKGAFVDIWWRNYEIIFIIDYNEYVDQTCLKMI